ncbi:hypothetical protein KKF38_02315 [Patescibacteria group bacterium]|nr:hypothetical protein [Patescibacteria group bacterium]
MSSVERKISEIAPEGVHTRVSRGVAEVIIGDEFRDVKVFFEVDGNRERVRSAIDILAFGIDSGSDLTVRLESDKTEKDELQELINDIEFALTHVCGITG